MTLLKSILLYIFWVSNKPAKLPVNQSPWLINYPQHYQVFYHTQPDISPGRFWSGDIIHCDMTAPLLAELWDSVGPGILAVPRLILLVELSRFEEIKQMFNLSLRERGAYGYTKKKRPVCTCLTVVDWSWPMRHPTLHWLLSVQLRILKSSKLIWEQP